MQETFLLILFSYCSIDYLDEAGSDPPSVSDVQAVPGENSKAYHIAAFTTKKFCLEGVTIYTDEFPSKARTFSKSVMSMSTGSTPDSKVLTYFLYFELEKYYCKVIINVNVKYHFYSRILKMLLGQHPHPLVRA